MQYWYRRQKKKNQLIRHLYYIWIPREKKKQEQQKQVYWDSQQISRSDWEILWRFELAPEDLVTVLEGGFVAGVYTAW